MVKYIPEYDRDIIYEVAGYTGPQIEATDAPGARLQWVPTLEAEKLRAMREYDRAEARWTDIAIEEYEQLHRVFDAEQAREVAAQRLRLAGAVMFVLLALQTINEIVALVRWWR